MRRPVFILASSSPRRIELLRQVGIRARVVKPTADETVRPGESPRALVRRLARDKARSVQRALGARADSAIIIAADTIVVAPNGRILNKPTSPADARKMLGMLSGRVHRVFTGFCILRGSRLSVRVCISRVRIRKLSPRDIRNYVATGEARDKAGAYAAQGLGTALIQSISGSYTNVVGLPVSDVLQSLEKDFGLALFSLESEASMSLRDEIRTRLQAIESRIDQARREAKRADPVTLIAVSKKQSVDSIEALYSLGHRDFGENYVQELATKAVALRERGCREIRWHFIGHLQSNKIRLLVPHVYCVHTVDSEKLALALDKQWQIQHAKAPLSVFFAVNIDAEASKSGLNPQTAANLILGLRDRTIGLRIEGLMCIPFGSDEPAAIRTAFARLRELEQQCQPVTRGQLSMGMSEDFSLAIAEGATHIRVGTALFGPRSIK